MRRRSRYSGAGTAPAPSAVAARALVAPVWVLAVLVLTALALAGCGLAVGSAPTAVRLLLTREFGARVLHRNGALRASEGETVLGLLTREYPVSTSSRGSLVGSIDGVPAGPQPGQSGKGEPGEQVSVWSYYVNGVQVTKSPARASVHPGDHIWWDLHDASQAGPTPAVVGSFPEPFLNGIEGERLPVRVECASVSAAACSAVTASLRRSGVPAAIAAIGSGGAPETLRVMVGPWAYLGGDLEAASIARGPRASGVYAQPSANARQLTLFDQQGQPVRTLGSDAGLIAATKGVKEAPVWVVTGTDAQGVALAAHAFNRAALEDRFALALASGEAIALPVAGSPAPRAP